MPEDIFDMRNVTILKKKTSRKKGGSIYFVLSVESKAFGLRNLCYSKLSVEMLLGYRIVGISRKLESELKKYALSPNVA